MPTVYFYFLNPESNQLMNHYDLIYITYSFLYFVDIYFKGNIFYIFKIQLGIYSILHANFLRF